MSQQSNYLFPIVLEILSQKPLLSENVKTLLKEIEDQLGNKTVNPRTLKEDLYELVSLGRNLGILGIQQDKIQLPFLLKHSKRSKKSSQVDVNPIVPEDTLKTDQFNTIPAPPWMEIDMRSMNPDATRGRKRSCSPRGENDKPTVSKRSRKSSVKRKRDM